MKLYLSSFKIGKNPDRLKKLLPKQAKGLYCCNPLDSAKPEVRARIQNDDLKELESIDLTAEPLDLRDYFGKVKLLKKKMEHVDFIYISGGNVYDLRLAMKLSGLDEILKNLVDTNFVYAGYSAAVCVLSPTLKGYHIVDKVGNKTYGEHDTIWEGLGVIDWQFAPHFESDHSESAGINKEIEYYKKHNMPYKALRDDEVIVMEV